MIRRRYTETVIALLGQFPAVALLGPRQVGKTTLALEIAAGCDSLYLDLESMADRAKLSDPVAFLAPHADRLVILDEVHRVPELFRELRGIIDEGRRAGRRHGQFLLLGSASLDLLRQTTESLAGRIALCELAPFDVLETDAGDLEALWVRGGFPDSFLAPDEPTSTVWRENFLRTYLERDVPLLGPRIPAETLRRFWTMLAHAQGGLLNAAEFARALAVDGKTVARYLDLLVDLLLVRRLPPLGANAGKRLVKSPRVYVRDSGLVHALLGIDDRDALLGHPVAGASWEGFVVENILRAAPDRVKASFYRTAAGAEMDLVLEWPGGEVWAIEIKRSPAPSLGRGFHSAREDLRPARTFVVYAGGERYAKADGVEVIGLRELCEMANTAAR
ncbi:MAG: ATP-binding protein [Lysobacterales bacterium]|nr:MAG: ATP-binding protein [Xanthomonadales bacterium]